MAGIYIHIPFCRQFCNYCDFYRIEAVHLIPDYINALKKEMVLRHDYLRDEDIDSIYFGGGTPSLLDINQLNDVFKTIVDHNRLNQECEITIEANPDDLNPEYLRHLKEETPVNRLSIGIQSFFDKDLKFMNRRHNASQSAACLLDAAGIGFDNISIDLIYGLPKMTSASWEENIRYAFRHNIQHVSAYHLTVEPGTVLYRTMKKRSQKMPSDDQSHFQYLLLCDMARDNGYQHYEISNFCLEGFQAIHNSGYWKQREYLGLGAAAHSYDLKSRQWNPADVRKYIRGMQKGAAVYTYESLDDKKRYNEYIMLSMRTQYGVHTKKIMEEFGEYAAKHFMNKASSFIASGQMVCTESMYKLTEDAWFVSDHIISRLLLD